MKLGKLAGWLASVAAATALLTAGALAWHPGSSSVVTLPQSEVVNHDYLAAGGQVEVDGTVNGDVYVAGGQVTVNGVVNGDVLAAGGMVTVAGTVNGNVRATGGQVAVDGTVSRNVTLAGGSLAIDHNAKIGGSVAAAGGSITLAAPLSGTINLAGGSVLISNTVAGDATIAARQLTVTQDGRINGSLNYWSNQPAQLAGSVSGAVTQHQLPRQPESHNANLVLVFYWLVVSFIVGALVLWLLPGFTATIAKNVQTRTWASLGWGFVGLIVTPVLALVLMITFVGAPLGVVLLIAYVIALMLAPLWVMIAVGKMIMARAGNSNRYLALLVGLLIYTVVSLIPIVGGIVVFLATLIGLGAFGTAKLALYRRLRQQKAL